MFRSTSLFLALVAAPASAQDAFEDQRYGIRFAVPTAWQRAPSPEASEEVVRYVSPVEYTVTGRDGAKRAVRPMLIVLAFLPGDSREGEDPYRAWLMQAFAGSKMSIGTSTEELAGARTRFETVIVEDGALDRTLTTWVFQIDGLDVALQFELPPGASAELAPIVRPVRDSFRFLAERDLDAVRRARGRDDDRPQWTADRAGWLALPLGARHERRRASEDAIFSEGRALAKARGLEARRARGFLVVSEVDARFTQRVTQAADVFLQWCEKSWDGISDDYVRGFVLEIRDNPDGIASAPGATLYRGFEVDEARVIIIEKDTYHGSSLGGIGALYNEIFDRYLQDKDVLLYRYMPRWLNAGLAELLVSAKVRGRKLVLEPNDDERDDVRTMYREDELLALSALMTMTDDEYAALRRDNPNLDDQAASVARFLLGPARKQDPAREFVPRYFARVVEVAEAESRDWDDERDIAAIVAEERAAPSALPAAGKAQPVDPEAERVRLERRLWLRRRQEVSAALAAQDLGWSDAEWTRLDRAYRRFVGRY